MKTLILIVISFALILTIFYILDPPIKINEAWMCSLTGSVKYKTKWIFWKTDQGIEITELEKWVVRKKGKVNHRWVQIRGTYFSIQGTLRSHETAPPIYHFPKNLYRLLIEKLSEKELEEFYKVLDVGTREEQEKAIKQTIDCLFKILESGKN